MTTLLADDERINDILLGSCEDVLKTLPDCCVDAIVCDPPYGLGTREPTAADIEHYLKGDALDTGGDFMGKAWSLPSVPTWKECFRVLKPGGYLLAMAGTRTWDIMSIGIRAAGFESRDTISSGFGSPCLQWLHGQGFPKSLNIAKELRKRAKAEKDVEKAKKLSQLAEQYEGWGTALKPAWEPVLMFRKPMDSTVADQIAETGTGGINIDGTRVEHASPEDFARHKAHVDRIKAEGGQWGDSWKNSSDLSGASDVSAAGRWPANATLTHSPECEGSVCVDGCPVKAVDEQSGDTKSGTKTASGRTREDTADWRFKEGTTAYADVGGASKYFAQFLPRTPFFYTGKASKTEKNTGVLKNRLKKGEELVRLKDELLTPAEIELLVEHLPTVGDDPDPKRPVQACEIPEVLRHLFVPVKQDDNSHPTVKPVSLMAWLVGMVTPKNGTVLDPYCGSGTTCVGALERDCNYIGIERDPLYQRIAKKRLHLLKGQALDRRANPGAPNLDDLIPD